MRIALIAEGLSTWCEQLVRGLDEHQFHLVAITATRPAPAPPAVQRAAASAVAMLCHGLFTDEGAAPSPFAAGLRTVADLAAPGRHPLAGTDIAGPLLDAWAAARQRDPYLPVLSVWEADRAAEFLEHALRPLSLMVPTADVCHATSGGLPALAALATKWRRGTPMLLTEHGVDLRERYLGFTADHPPGVKTVMLRFFRALTRLSYRCADVIAPVSEFNRRWALRHGADPSAVVVVPNGVDVKRFPPLRAEPERPTVAWVGRVEPRKDLETLIRAFQLVAVRVPGAHLRLFGPVPRESAAYASGCAALADGLGLGDAVRFEGPVACSREGFAAGHVVALSSVSESLPDSVLEAMMCARPTVSTDVGGVAEAVAGAGVVVPPREPDSLAHACAGLLTDEHRRRTLGALGRRRALGAFSLHRFLREYRTLYGTLVA